MVTKSIIPLSVFGTGIDRYVSPGYGLLLHLLNQYRNAGAGVHVYILKTDGGPPPGRLATVYAGVYGFTKIVY